MADLTETGLDKAISLCARLLRVHSFYTVGVQQAK
jgi:hypothetical protein